MRSDAKMVNQNIMLQEKIFEQQEEIKQLRCYLRDIFEQEENKIVAASYEDGIEAGSVVTEGAPPMGGANN